MPKRLPEKDSSIYEVEDPTIYNDKDVTAEDRQAAQVTSHQEAMRHAKEYGEKTGDRPLVERAKAELSKTQSVLKDKEHLLKKDKEHLLKVDNLQKLVTDLLSKRVSLEQTQQTIKKQLVEINALNEQIKQVNPEVNLIEPAQPLQEQLGKIKQQLADFEYTKQQLKEAQQALKELKKLTANIKDFSDVDKEKIFVALRQIDTGSDFKKQIKGIHLALARIYEDLFMEDNDPNKAIKIAEQYNLIKEYDKAKEWHIKAGNAYENLFDKTYGYYYAELAIEQYRIAGQSSKIKELQSKIEHDRNL